MKEISNKLLDGALNEPERFPEFIKSFYIYVKLAQPYHTKEERNTMIRLNLAMWSVAADYKLILYTRMTPKDQIIWTKSCLDNPHTYGATVSMVSEYFNAEGIELSEKLFGIKQNPTKYDSPPPISVFNAILIQRETERHSRPGYLLN